MKVVDVTLRLSTQNDWEITLRDVLDFIENKFARYPDPDWGRGRGAINYVDMEVRTTRAVDDG